MSRLAVSPTLSMSRLVVLWIYYLIENASFSFTRYISFFNFNLQTQKAKIFRYLKTFSLEFFFFRYFLLFLIHIS